MRIIFSQIFSDSPQSYVRQKLERALRRRTAELNDDAVSQKVASVVNHLGTSVPVALSDAFYEITAEQEAEIEARKRCALVTIWRESPLLEGEAVKDDLFTFLQKPFESLPANTAVLKRTTNMAEIYYLFDDLQVVAGDLQFIEPAPVPYTTEEAGSRPLMSAAAKAITATSIAKKLGSGLVDGIAGTIGGLIFEAIFPPGAPDYFDEVYKEIRNIVKQELAQNTITNINGKVNGVVLWQKNTYKPMKEGNASRKDLSKEVRPFVNDLYLNAVGILMEKEYAKPGLPVFMVAAGVHLALMQEQALVDEKQQNPALSTYATSVKLNAQTYYQHLVDTFKAIVTDRENAVEIRYDPLMIDGDPSSPWINKKDRYYWFDKINEKRGNFHEEYQDKEKKTHSGREEAEADRQNYLSRVRTELANNMDDPMGTGSLWQKLTLKPIPSLALT